MNRRDRDRRLREVRDALRFAWRSGRPVELTLQHGRRRPRVAGRVVYVATSGAFVLVADGGEPDLAIGERPGPLHVPVDRVRVVDVQQGRRGGFVRLVPPPSPARRFP